jgi:hypothetical protein
MPSVADATGNPIDAFVRARWYLEKLQRPSSCFPAFLIGFFGPPGWL